MSTFFDTATGHESSKISNNNPQKPGGQLLTSCKITDFNGVISKMAPVSIHGHMTMNNRYLTIRYGQIDMYLFI